MSANLKSLLDPARRASADAWDAKAAAAMMADAKRIAAKPPFDELIEHLEKAQSLAAGLIGQMTEVEGVHDQISDALHFARKECWPIGEQSPADAKHDVSEEFYMEQARGLA